MAIRFGVSPIAWVNDDMPALGGETALATILADARDIGFAGVELGGKFPRDPQVLRPILAAHGLDLVGGWFSGSLLTRDVAAEMAAARPHLALLEALGCAVFVDAETSNSIHGRMATPLSRTPRLDAEGWKLFGARLTRFAELVAAEGFRFAYHHHLGTVVEGPEDLDALLGATGEVVGLTVDTGHAALGGIDPLALIRGHPGRIAHVHCKNVRADVFAGVRENGLSFLQGVLAGMFTVPGDGGLDFGALMRSLAEIGYAGWIVVEAEQDPAVADPRVCGALGLRTLRREARAAGLEEAA
jgi:inosose dehydratase